MRHFLASTCLVLASIWVAVPAQGEEYLVLSQVAGGSALQRYDGATNSFLGDFGPIFPSFPWTFEVSEVDQYVYIPGPGGSISAYDDTGMLLGTIVQSGTSGMGTPSQIRARGDILYVVDGSSKVYLFNRHTGNPITTLSGDPAAGYSYLDVEGPWIVVSSWGNNSIEYFDRVSGAYKGPYVLGISGPSTWTCSPMVMSTC